MGPHAGLLPGFGRVQHVAQLAQVRPTVLRTMQLVVSAGGSQSGCGKPHSMKAGSESLRWVIHRFNVLAPGLAVDINSHCLFLAPTLQEHFSGRKLDAPYRPARISHFMPLGPLPGKLKSLLNTNVDPVVAVLIWVEGEAYALA